MNSSAISRVRDVTVTVQRREAFLADEKDARATWDAAVAAVPITLVADRVLPAARSVKDLVAHMAAWERWAEERLAARIEGGPALQIPDWHAFEHEFNERAYGKWKDEPWDAVASEAASAYAAFRELVEQLDDEQLAKTEGLITGCGSRHYAEYLGHIRDLVDHLPLQTSFATARLRLRSLRPSDAPALFEMFSDPEVMRYIPPGPGLTLERVQRSIDRRVAMERTTGLTLWAVERRDAPGEVIGQCGFALIDGKGPDIEIAYHYVRRAWGHGFATEAAIACLERGFGPLALDRVIAICYPENTASWRVMEKAGMRSDGEGEYYGVHMKRHVADRATWRRPDGTGIIMMTCIGSSPRS